MFLLSDLNYFSPIKYSQYLKLNIKLHVQYCRGDQYNSFKILQNASNRESRGLHG